MQPTERFLRVFALCSSSANTNVKAYAKEPTKWHCRFTPCSLFYNNVQKTPLQVTLMTREDVSWLVTVGHRPQTLDDNISSETFSAENTHLFSMHLFGGRLHYIHLQIAARQLQGLCVKEKRFKCKSTQASGTP